MNSKRFVGSITLLVMLLASSMGVRADTSPPQLKGVTALLGPAVPESRMTVERGGHTTVNNTNQLEAALYDNQALANVTGSNTIATSAFSGMSGYATVVQNSGNNVIIQSATILNVKLQ